MLEVDLLEAKARKRRLYFAVATGLFIGGLAIALIPTLISKTQPEQQILTTENPPERPNEVTEKNLVQSVEPDSVNQPIQSPTIQLSDQSEFEEQFFAAVKTYDETVEPNIDNYQSILGDQGFMNTIRGFQQDIAAKAAQEQYKDGLTILKKMTQVATDRITQENNRLEKLLKQVTDAWAIKDIDLMSASLKSARLISSNNKKIVEYSSLLSDWPEVETLLNRAAERESKGKIDDAIQSLQQISKLNHDIDNLSSRIDSLQTKQKDILETRLIEQLFLALEKSDLSSANEAIQRLLKAGIPESAYTHLLADYNQKKYDAEFVIVSNAMDSAIVKDDWTKAKQLVDQNQRVFGSEPRFKARAEAIYKIHKGIAEVSNALAKPEQLLSSRVRADAHTLLERISPDLNMSLQLRSKADQLSALLASYRTKVPVTVVSDGLTYIEVKSVGKVGETTGRVVELLPGKYVFIGKKPGYVSKQSEINVEPGTPAQIKVIADEPI